MISVIVPVYNVENYLDKCLGSIASQTVTDLEVILVDDGSSDMSGMICDAWAKKDARFRVMHRQNNGVSSARNAALQAAKGDFIAFVDADDYINKDMFRLLLNALAEDADIAVCGFNTVEQGTVSQVLCDEKMCVNSAQAARLCIQKGEWGLVIWNKLFRRSVVFSGAESVRFPEDIFIGEDALWLIEVCCRSQKAVYVPEACYYYIKRQNSAVYKSKRERLVESSASRYASAVRGYEILKNAGNSCAFLMFRRGVFSARDIACAAYCESNEKVYREWIKKFHSALSDYKQMVGKGKDILFLLKNDILYYAMQFHLPKKWVQKLLQFK